ncbi:hypothetical protein GOP47_0015382 [Adiantum capillus-veneris]|uniref:Uncharacterized protein n=1 Tax=Adiantum capillus-veneris TaxID=13818 RepID=A0A9D4UJL2_ADICA|nr:hypothetical protein GOP47_0015382 [Adiantum capillus-veneris]
MAITKFQGGGFLSASGEESVVRQRWQSYLELAMACGDQNSSLEASVMLVSTVVTFSYYIRDTFSARKDEEAIKFGLLSCMKLALKPIVSYLCSK